MKGKNDPDNLFRGNWNIACLIDRAGARASCPGQKPNRWYRPDSSMRPAVLSRRQSPIDHALSGFGIAVSLDVDLSERLFQLLLILSR